MTFENIVNKMTNWERNQWAKAGYPGLVHGKPGKTKDIAVLSKRPEAAAAMRRITGYVTTMSAPFAISADESKS